MLKPFDSRSSVCPMQRLSSGLDRLAPPRVIGIYARRGRPSADARFVLAFGQFSSLDIRNSSISAILCKDRVVGRMCPVLLVQPRTT